MTTANDATNAAQPETKVPEVPTLRTDDPKLRSFVDAVREILQVREGKRGNPLDANVTYRDLIAAGLAQATSDGNLVGAPPPTGGTGGTGGTTPPSTIPPLPSFPEPLPFCATNFDTPPAPSGLTATGTFSAIVLQWNPGNFQCTAYTEIWRAANNNLSEAQSNGLYATTGAGRFTDAVGNARIYWYWVRLVSFTDVKGPFNSSSGTAGQTASDPTYLLGVLTGQITQTQLHPSLGTPIQSLFTRYGNTAFSDSDFIQLYQKVDDNAEAIEALSTVSVANRTFFQNAQPPNPFLDPPAAPYVLHLGDMWYDTTTGKNLPSYRWNNTAWVFINQGVRTFYQDDMPLAPQGPFNVGDQWFDKNDSNKPYLWNGTAWIPHLDQYTAAYVINLNKTQIGYATFIGACTVGGVAYPADVVFDNNGAILHYEDVVLWNSTHTTNATGKLLWHEGMPLATAVKQVGVIVNGTGVAMEDRFEAQAVDNTHFNAMYTLKIDNQGYVTGFGLSSENPNGSAWPKSTFEVRADSFAIAPAAAPNWNSGVTYAIYQRVTYAPNGKVYESLAGGNVGIPPFGSGASTSWWKDLSKVIPFIARTVSTVIDGRTYPPGVWMDSAWIANATIGSAQIKYVNADIVNTAFYMTSPKLAGAEVFTNELYVFDDGQFTKTQSVDPNSGLLVTTSIEWNGWPAVGKYPEGLAARKIGEHFFVEFSGTLRSPDFQSTVKGWALNADGVAELQQAVIRGTIYAQAGMIGGCTIEANAIHSSNYNATSHAGWNIAADGSASFNAISIYNAQGSLVFGSSGLPWTSVTGIPSNVYNQNISIAPDGTLVGAGGGQVTLPGLGHSNFRVVTSGGSNTIGLPVSPGFYVNGAIFPGSLGRSYTLVKIRRSDNVVDFVLTYDLWINAANATALANELNATQNDHIVVVFTWDEPQNNRLVTALVNAMYRCGASKHVFGNTVDFKQRGAYALVGIPNIGEGNGAEAYSGQSDSSSVAWCDVGIAVDKGGNIVGITGATTPRGLVSTGNPINTGNISTFINAGAVGNLYIGNFISSFNFGQPAYAGAPVGAIDANGNITNNGSQGWAIGKSGDAVFHDVYARGNITATDIVADTITVGMIKNNQITNTNAGVGGETAECTVDDGGTANGGTGSTILQGVAYGTASANMQSTAVSVFLERHDGGSWTQVSSVSVTVLGVPYSGGENDGYRASSYSIPIQTKLNAQGAKTYRIRCPSYDLFAAVSIVGTGMKK